MEQQVRKDSFQERYLSMGLFGHYFPNDLYQIEYKPANPVYLLAMPQPSYQRKVEDGQ